MANGEFIKPDKLNWERAYNRVLENSRSDFVPLRYDFWLLEENKNEYISRAKQVLTQEHYNPSPLQIVEIPKADLTTRPAAIAELDDRLIYQALVDHIAEIVEPQVLEVVFSHRLVSDYDATHMFREYDESYGAYLKKQRELCEDGTYKYVVVTDVASYYERIYHHRLIQLLEGLGCDLSLIKTLGHLLREWNNGDSHGIPQSFWASDYLGNVYLHQVDVFMQMQGCRYLRYVDDISIFCTSQNEGRVILLNLSKQLRSLGLGLNAAKTKILPIKDYLPYLITATERIEEAVQEMLQDVHLSLNPYFDEFTEEDISEIENDINREAIHRVFDNVISQSQINETLLKACLKIMTGIEDPYGKSFVLDNLSEYSHLSSYFGNYLCKCPFDITDRNHLITFMNSENNIYDWQTMWLIRYFGREEICSETRVLLRNIFQNRNHNNALRSLAAFILGNKGNITDQRFIKENYDSESDLVIRRGIICGLLNLIKSERNHFLKYHQHDCWCIKIACNTILKL